MSSLSVGGLARIWQNQFADAQAHMPLFARWQWWQAMGKWLELPELQTLQIDHGTQTQFYALSTQGAVWRSMRHPHAPFGLWACQQPQQDAAALASALADWRGPPIYATGIPAELPDTDGLVIRRAEGYHRLHPQRLSGGLRRNLQRLARRATEEVGAPRVEVIRDVQSQPDAFSRFLALEATEWKRAQGSSVSQEPGARVFYADLAEHFSGQGLEIAFLYLGDQAVATQFSITSAGELWLLKLGYEQPFQQYAPGAQLLLQTLQAQPERPLHLHGRVEWGERWHPQWHPSCHACNLGLPGLRLAHPLLARHWRRHNVSDSSP